MSRALYRRLMGQAGQKAPASSSSGDGVESPPPVEETAPTLTPSSTAEAAPETPAGKVQGVNYYKRGGMFYSYVPGEGLGIDELESISEKGIKKAIRRRLKSMAVEETEHDASEATEGPGDPEPDGENDGDAEAPGTEEA